MELGVYLLLDVSASMFGPGLEVVRGAYEGSRVALEEAFGKGVRIRYSVLTYESQTTVLWRHQNFEGSQLPTDLKAEGTSRLGEAWQIVENWLLEDSDISKVCLLFTDGNANDNWRPVGERLKRDHFVMMGIGCGRGANLNELSPFLDTVIAWEKYDHNDFRQLLEEICKPLFLGKQTQ